MNIIVEFALVTVGYMFIINFVMKKVGGVELKVLEADIKKLMAKARKGDDGSMKKMQGLNSKRMKLAMKAQLFLMPIVLPALYFIKKRYLGVVEWTMFGKTFGWLWTFFLLGIPASMIADRVVKKY